MTGTPVSRAVSTARRAAARTVESPRRSTTPFWKSMTSRAVSVISRTLRSAGPGETVGDGGGQREVGVLGRLGQLVELDLGAFFEVRVVRDADDRPAAALEVRLQPVEVDRAAAARPDHRQH